MKPLLEVNSVSKAYRIKKGFLRKENFWALRDLSLSIMPAEILGVVGESGSGKSTLGKLILRLERPTEGSLLFKGRDIYGLGKEYTRHVSVVFQDPRASLNPRMKVREILEEPLIVHGIREREDKVKEVMKLVNLSEEFLERKPEQLSGGQRQRVAIGRAIILNPELIVADEPTASLDVAIQEQILSLILSLKERGYSFLFITHDMRVVEKISDRIAVIYGGVLMELGSKEEVLKEPMNPYTKFLLGSLPVRHPRDRKREELQEIEYHIPEKGCPFYPRCPERLQDCSESLRRKEIDGRFIACNLY